MELNGSIERPVEEVNQEAKNQNDLKDANGNEPIITGAFSAFNN